MAVSANDVRALRERTGLGLAECKRILQNNELHDMLDAAKTVKELKFIIRSLLPDPQYFP